MFIAGRSDGGRLGGALAGGERRAGGLLGGALLGGLLLGGLLLGGLLLGGLLRGGALLAREAPTAAALGGGGGGGASGLTLGLLVSGNKTLMTRAIDSVAGWTPGCSLFTSCSSARVWLSVPSAFFTQVFPSTSVDAYSASNRAPTDRAMLWAIPITSLGTFSSCCRASSALPKASRACRASADDE
jgi:hypothetical protein